MFQMEPLQAMYKGRYVSVSVVTNGPFWLIDRFFTFLLDCSFGKIILPHLKSSIPAGFCKLNRHWNLFAKKAQHSWLVHIIFRIWTMHMHEVFLWKGILCGCVNVSIRPLLREEGPGDEAMGIKAYNTFDMIHF